MQLWTKSCSEFRMIVKWCTKDADDETVYYVRNASYQKLEITQANFPEILREYKSSNSTVSSDALVSPENFDTFCAKRTVFYELRYNRMNPFESTCLCPYYMQRATCKHVLAFGIHMGATIPPECDFRQVTVAKRKRGRPHSRMHALQRDRSIVDIEQVDLTVDNACAETSVDTAGVHHLFRAVDQEAGEKRASLAAAQDTAVHTFHGHASPAPVAPPPSPNPSLTNENLALFAALIRDNPNIVALAQSRQI